MDWSHPHANNYMLHTKNRGKDAPYEGCASFLKVEILSEIVRMLSEIVRMLSEKVGMLSEIVETLFNKVEFIYCRRNLKKYKAQPFYYQ